MTTTIVSALVGLVCTSLSSVVTFFLTRRKYNIEVDTQQIENMNRSFDIYKKMMNESLALQNVKIVEQDNKIKELQEENNNLKKEIRSLQVQMAQLIGAACFNTACDNRKADFSINPKHS